jgi:hypothetical protein
MNTIKRIVGRMLATLNSGNTEKEPVMFTRLLGGFVLVLVFALGAVAITPTQASAQGKQLQALGGETSGVVSLSWNPHTSNNPSYFVDITGQRVCAITTADGSIADCVSITIPAGAAVTPLNPNDSGIRLFTIGAGTGGSMQVCAVVGNVTAATTTCTAH